MGATQAPIIAYGIVDDLFAVLPVLKEELQKTRAESQLAAVNKRGTTSFRGTMEKIDAVIIGGGLAGLSCAYKLADAGMQVIVLERGDFPGSKNVTGGRLYLMPVKDLIGDMLDGAPFERKVVSERWSLMGETNSLSLAFSSDRFSKEDHSYTILRARLDRWLSEKLMAKGVFVIPKYRVDDLIFEGDSVSGVRIGTEEIYAHAVVACDGVLSFMARKAGLTRRSSSSPRRRSTTGLTSTPPRA
jgi:flavin-dependent dehydrogenase